MENNTCTWKQVCFCFMGGNSMENKHGTKYVSVIWVVTVDIK